MSASAPLAEALSAYLSRQRCQPVEIGALRRLAGGASHETWAFDASCGDSAPEALVLRRDFAHGLLDEAFTGGVATEFFLLETLHAAALPVPRPRYCETNAQALGTPFMIVERAAGTDLRKLLAEQARHASISVARRRASGEALVALQARLHQLPAPPGADCTPMQPPQDCVQHEITRWAQLIASSSRARPLLNTAVQWLRIHAPPLSRAALVHGDFKANNLVTDTQRLWQDKSATILDWEMAHLGDPLEDLAWTLLWSTPDDLVGGLLNRSEYISAYQAASGQVVEAARLAYWEIFACVKLAAIFIAGVRPTNDAHAQRPMLVMLGRAVAVLEYDLAGRLRRALGAVHAA